MENTKFLKTYLTKKLDFSEQTAEQALVPFLRQKDILDELCKTLEKGEFPQEMICEQGFTARSLYEKYGKMMRSVFDAYGFLLVLRERPAQMLDIINSGFPVK